MKEIETSKITLGTAQLGLKYGISNKIGKPNLNLIDKILKTATQNNIFSFDTAPDYGNSEEILGNYFNENKNNFEPTIVTKIPSIRHTNNQPTFDEVYEKIKVSVLNSIARLRLDKISVSLLHDPNDMVRYNGYIVKSLIKLKEEGLVRFIGASVYSPEDVETFLEINELDVIQIPINLFDLRLIRMGLLDDLINAKKIIFARSTFLQGLFFLQPNELPQNLSSAKPFLSKLTEISYKYKISIPRLALTFVRDIRGIESMIIGVENEKQLINNIDMLQSAPLPNEVIEEIHRSFNEVPDKIINPSMWSLGDSKND